MPNRICKYCSYELKSNDYYFCSNCGAVLEYSQIKEPKVKDQNITEINLKSNNYFFSYLSKIFNSVYFFVFILVLSVIFALFVFALNNKKYFTSFEKSNFNGNQYQNISNQDQQTNQLDECSKMFKCSTFNKSNISLLVPYDVTLYAEAFDYNVLSGLLVQYNSNYSTLVDTLSYLKPTDIALFWQNIENQNYFTFILYSNVTPNDSIISLLTNQTNQVTINKINSYYVISNNPNVMQNIQDTQNKINKSIYNNTMYNQAIKTNQNGQILIINNSSENTAKFNEYLNSDQVPLIVKQMITNLISQNSGYIVL